MAKSTKNTYKASRKGNYKPVVKMNDGGDVSLLNYSDRAEYIEEHYAPFIKEAQMIFTIYGSSLEYDYKKDRKELLNEIIGHYKSISDYTEKNLPQETIYEIDDWDLVRREIDPETDEVYDKTILEQINADNTYNFSYLGLVDLNWRVYYDADYEKYFYVIMPHLGGDIRGNYGDAFILEGNDKDELFYRFYEEFVSGGASIYFQFADGSEVGFDSEQDSDVFYFRLNEIYEPTGMAEKFVSDFQKFDSWKGDEFLEETLNIFLMRQGQLPKMMAGGKLDDETPRAYIQILGYQEGSWFNLSDFSDGSDFIDHIQEWMDSLNEEYGGNREEFEVVGIVGFGESLYDRYMGRNEFDEIIEAYENYQSSDFPSGVITAYQDNMSNGTRTLADIIDEMNNNFFGKYNNYADFGYAMVEEHGVFTPSSYNIYITDTDKRIIAGEESDMFVREMDFDDMLKIATNTKEEYENEKDKLEERYEEIEVEISDLQDLQEDTDNEDEYNRISDEIEERELILEEIRESLNDIDSRYENEARNEALEIIYDEQIKYLENDLDEWLSERGYTYDDLPSFISIDYETIGEEESDNYLVVEYDGELYFFNNYEKGGRIKASKNKPKYQYYIVENNTKKLVSGYNTKAEAIEQRALLVKEYPSMRFEIFTLGNLEKQTDLDVYSKKDYVELSTLDKIKQVSVDAYRYGQEKVGQANEFLKRNDVKGRIKRGAKSVWEKTKQGGNWLKRQWEEADFGDGKGKAKFFADGGSINNILASFEKDGETFELIAYYDNGEIHFESVQNRLKGDDKEVIETYYDEVEALREFENLKQELNATRSTIDRTKHWTETSATNLIYYHFNQPFNFQYIIEEDDVLDLSDILYELEKKGEQYKSYSFSEYERALQNKEVRDFLNNLLIKYGDKLDESYANGGGVGRISEKDFVEKKQLKRGNTLIKLEKLSNPTYYRVRYIDLIDNEEISSYGSPYFQDVIFDINETKYADGGEILWVDNFELDQDKINRAKYIINYNRGIYTIIDNKTKKEITSFPTQISAVKYINTELNKFDDGGDVLTKPRPVTTPAPTKTPSPSKPDRNNPYKPKTTPKPKASKYDYIWIVE